MTPRTSSESWSTSRAWLPGIDADVAEARVNTAFPPEHLKTIKDIVFAGKHPSEILHEAFRQHMRDLGHVNARIAVGGAAFKAVQSGQRSDGSLPAHMQITYDQLPQKAGMEPSTYGALQTQSNPEHKGKLTWEDDVRKAELELAGATPLEKGKNDATPWDWTRKDWPALKDFKPVGADGDQRSEQERQEDKDLERAIHDWQASGVTDDDASSDGKASGAPKRDEIVDRAQPRHQCKAVEYLLKLGVKSRAGADGGREFLLHRGTDTHERQTVLDADGRHLNFDRNTSWTPDPGVAQAFVANSMPAMSSRAHPGFRAGMARAYTLPRVMSAWVPAKAIAVVPNSFRFSHLMYRREHETIVRPHRGELVREQRGGSRVDAPDEFGKAEEAALHKGGRRGAAPASIGAKPRAALKAEALEVGLRAATLILAKGAPESLSPKSNAFISAGDNPEDDAPDPAPGRPLDANEDGIPELMRHPEQKRLLHGLDLGADTDFPNGAEYGFHDRSGSLSWVKKGKKPVLVKRTVDDRGLNGNFSEARREAAYYNMGKEFFGLGRYLTPTVAFRHPVTENEHVASAGIPKATHLDGHIMKNEVVKGLRESGELDKIALMNVVLGNIDRHHGNFMFSPKGLHLIDHGGTLWDPGASPWERSHDCLHGWPKPEYYPETEAPYRGYTGWANFSRPIHPLAREWFLGLQPHKARSLLTAMGVPANHREPVLEKLTSLRAAMRVHPEYTKKELHDWLLATHKLNQERKPSKFPGIRTQIGPKAALKAEALEVGLRAMTLALAENGNGGVLRGLRTTDRRARGHLSTSQRVNSDFDPFADGDSEDDDSAPKPMRSSDGDEDGISESMRHPEQKRLLHGPDLGAKDDAPVSAPKPMRPLDANEDGIPELMRHPEQKRLLHGLDLGATPPPPWGAKRGIHGLRNALSWVKKGKIPVLVKQTIDDLGLNGNFSEARREAAYYNMAKEFFGLGKYLPATVAFRHPLTGKEHVASAGIPNARHLDGEVTKNETLRDLQESGGLDKIAIMNVIAGNIDRHMGNFMLSPKGLHLIDHGGTLWDPRDPPFERSHERLHGWPKPAYYPEGYDLDHDCNPWGYPSEPIHPLARKWLLGLQPHKAMSLLTDMGVPVNHQEPVLEKLISLQAAAKLHPQYTKRELHDWLLVAHELNQKSRTT